MTNRKTALETFNAILAQPSATIRKFQLMKCFRTLLPDNAKELSAADLATLIRKQIEVAR